MHTIESKRIWLACIGSMLLMAASGLQAAERDDSPGSTAQIIDRYVQATETHEDALRGASMQVNIEASIPKLKEHGSLKALRKISKVGQVTYRVLGFQGDNTVKNDVIARYLQAEQQGQGDQTIAISPANYKFKLRGRRPTMSGRDVYVFQIAPRKNRIGLFKGEIWIDTKTALPVMEKGRLVKNPSIWFKKVDFERDFAIQNGVAVPSHMSSTIDVRLVGTVQLNIDYSNFEQNPEPDENGAQSVALAAAAGS